MSDAASPSKAETERWFTEHLRPPSPWAFRIIDPREAFFTTTFNL
jgi:hypothetical protein